MSSSVFARTDRRRFAGLLLQIRGLVYLLAGVPFLMFADVGTRIAITGIAGLLAVAGVPLVFRHKERGAGLRAAAVVDLGVAYGLWVANPAADSITLVLVVWTVAVSVFMGSPSSGGRFALTACVLELSKIALLVAAPSVVSLDHTDLPWFILGRTVIIGGSYVMLRVVDQYVVAISMAAETGSQRYRRLMDAAPTAFVVVASDKVVFANSAARALIGDEEKSFVGSSFSGIVDPGQRSRFSECVRRATERLEPVELEELRLIAGSGEERYVNVTVTAVDYGNDLAVQIAMHDVSAQVKAETELAAAKLNYREFFHRVPVALYRSRPDGEIIEANRALVDLLGARSESELIGRNAKSFFVEASDRQRLRSILDEHRIVVGFESQILRLDGATIWTRDTARLIDTDIGPIYEGAMVDVTARRNIEDELWSRAVQQEAAASIGQMALEVDDIETVMRSVSETVARVLQTDAAAVVTRPSGGDFELLGHNEAFDIDAASLSSLADRAHMTAAPVVLRNSRDVALAAPGLVERSINSSIAVVIPGSEIPLGTLAALSMTERVFTSDDLNFLHSVASVVAAAVDRASAHDRLEKLLRSKDDFVASVSHELRTPLTVVTGMAHELHERWKELGDEEVDEYTQLLVEQSRDMSDLIEDLLVAARSNIGSVAVVNQPMQLADQVENVLTSLSVPPPKEITVSVEPGFVDGDPIRVRQVLRNLLTNAVRYGGNHIEVVMSSTTGSRAVEVIDDGPGIPEGDRERIFVAYERAHDAQGQPGSVGLGLTVSRTLADLMGGSLTYSYDGRSVFRLELARDSAVEAEQRVGEAPAAVPAPIRTVGAARFGVDVGLID